jgi:hypothetical protein
MRLSNFPLPYPDELFFSLVARFAAWLRYPSLKEGVREFVLKNLKYKGFSHVFQILILFFQRQSE